MLSFLLTPVKIWQRLDYGLRASMDHPMLKGSGSVQSRLWEKSYKMCCENYHFDDYHEKSDIPILNLDLMRK